MTAPLPYFPECKKPEYAVRNPQCRKTAAYSEMTAKVNEIMAELMADGTLDALAEKYSLTLVK